MHFAPTLSVLHRHIRACTHTLQLRSHGAYLLNILFCVLFFRLVLYHEPIYISIIIPMHHLFRGQIIFHWMALYKLFNQLPSVGYLICFFSLLVCFTLQISFSLSPFLPSSLSPSFLYNHHEINALDLFASIRSICLGPIFRGWSSGQRMPLFLGFWYVHYSVLWEDRTDADKKDCNLDPRTVPSSEASLSSLHWEL